MKAKALKNFTYKARQLKIGSIYDFNADDAASLEANGHVKIKKEKEQKVSTRKTKEQK